MLRFISILLLSSFIASADTGDTTFVQVHNSTDMTWYGHYKDWGEFPNGESYRKVLMHFTMGCASTGCSGWDYDVHILMRHRTGIIDSNLVLAPNFKLNNEVIDSASVSYSQTYSTVWDSVNGTSSQQANDTLTLVLFQDQDNPTIATDTLYVFAGNYFNPIFDGQGNITDSTLVIADTSLYLVNTDTYNLYEVINDFELGRAITPYGTYMNPANSSYGTNGYTENWKHVFTFDVTDFQHLLKDSIEIDAFYSGWSSGFSVTLDFEFIEGTPPRMPIDLRNVYKNGASGYSYDNSNDFETNQMPMVKHPVVADAKEFKLQFVPSGHGQAGEFTPNIGYTARVNGTTVGGNTIWKDDCGFNAIWPQGGTWIFDRANWCPGEAVPIFNHEITSFVDSQDSVSIDINFSNFNPSADASYSCAVQLFQYKEINFNIDAEVTDILAPSNKDIYSRFNPVCHNPIVKIRNSGAEELTSLDIQFGVEGGTIQTYQWSGNLKFMEEEEVILGQMSNYGTSNTFIVTTSNPNGQNDEHTENDRMVSEFENVPVYKPSFIVRMKTNNYGSQNSWKITNQWDDVVYSRSGLESNALYADTLSLPNGCYTFRIDDTGGDGLDFWYWDQVGQPDGSGFLNFMYYDTVTVFKSFHKDFGSAIVHSFRVTNGTDITTPERIGSFKVYPSVSQGQVTIESHFDLPAETTLSLLNISGHQVLEQKMSPNQSSKILDISNLANGIYLLQLKRKGKINTKKIMLNR